MHFDFLGWWTEGKHEVSDGGKKRDRRVTLPRPCHRIDPFFSSMHHLVRDAFCNPSSAQFNVENLTRPLLNVSLRPITQSATLVSDETESCPDQELGATDVL